MWKVDEEKKFFNVYTVKFRDVLITFFLPLENFLMRKSQLSSDIDKSSAYVIVILLLEFLYCEFMVFSTIDFSGRIPNYQVYPQLGCQARYSRTVGEAEWDQDKDVRLHPWPGYRLRCRVRRPGTILIFVYFNILIET
jgi:hypothetical protein